MTNDEVKHKFNETFIVENPSARRKANKFKQTKNFSWNVQPLKLYFMMHIVRKLPSKQYKREYVNDLKIVVKNGIIVKRQYFNR